MKERVKRLVFNKNPGLNNRPQTPGAELRERITAIKTAEQQPDSA